MQGICSDDKGQTMSVVHESFVYEILVHMGIGKVSRGLGRGLAPNPVSYTHLTLPTILRV